MSNGYIVAADADIAAARDIADGFELELINTNTIADPASVASALAGAPNVGLVLSAAAAEDQVFTALMRGVATQVNSAQLILVTPEARALFDYLPQAWPSMSLEQARLRARALWEQRHPGGLPAEEPAHAHPLPPSQHDEPPAAGDAPQAPPETQQQQQQADQLAEQEPPPVTGGDVGGAVSAGAPSDDRGASESFGHLGTSDAEAHQAEPPIADAAPSAPPAAAAPSEPPAPAPAPESAPPEPAEATLAAPQAAPPARARAITAPSAPADATAFAPKKLRRGTPELVLIAIHQPKDLAAVIKAARKIDPRAAPAPSGMRIGEVALGASVGVSLEVRGASCDGTVQRRTWDGEPIDFNFSVEPDAEVKQAVFLARVFVDDAQIGVLAFTRPVSGPAKQAAGLGDKIRLKRHKRVFLSYSSKDRETVSAIASAYSAAGVPHFWDRASLKSGEEWSPRLRREIEHADLFHLCWSRAASESEWVEKEAEYALTRRRRSNGKRPDITVQMLDGPPWAKHSPSLDSINFDDFVRAAIVGYARGDGSS